MNKDIDRELLSKRLEYYREMFKVELKEYPDFNTDYHLGRFIVGKNYKIKDINIQLAEYFKFRKEKDYKRVAQINFNERLDDFKNDLNVDFYHHSKDFRPVVVICPTTKGTERILNNFQLTEIEDVIINRRERLLHIIYPILSNLKKERVHKNIVIINLKNISIWKCFNAKLKCFLKTVISTGDKYYPELS